MIDFIVIIVILAIIGLALYYMYKEKQKGVACIGCPDAKTCKSKNCQCSLDQYRKDRDGE